MAEGSAAGARPAVTRAQYWFAAGTMVFASVIFSGSGIAGRAAAGQVPPMAMSFWRWAIGFLVLAAVGWRPLWRGRAIVARNVPKLCAFALTGVVGFSVPYYIGLEVRPAVNAAVLNASGPVLTLFLAMAVLGTRITAVQGAGIAIAILGALAIVAQGSLTLLLGLDVEVGDFYLLAAFLSWSIYVVMFKWRPAGLEETAFLVAMAGLAALMMLPLYLYEAAQGRTFEVNAATALIIGYTGVLPSALGYVCWSFAIRVLGPNTASLSQYLSPAFGVILAVLILGEEVRGYHYAGIALTFAGVFLATRRQMG
jgi:drug/metabolite transporter (DMT)-like permease